MATQIEKLAPWIAEEPREDDIVEGMETTIGFVTREALYSTKETGKDVEIVVAVRYMLYLGIPGLIALACGNTGAAIPTMAVALPGLCGHYKCGGVITVCLN